jgi:hypothetical protein
LGAVWSAELERTARISVALALAAVTVAGASAGGAHGAQPGPGAPEAAIVVGDEAPALERLAARELQRNLALVTGARLPIIRHSESRSTAPRALLLVGRPQTNGAIAELAARGELPQAAPAAEGFLLKTVTVRERQSIAVVGGDDAGTLYGAYDLLERYGARFQIDRDVLPETTQPFEVKQLDVARRPAQKVRGLLPWNDFLNGPSAFSYADYKHYVDQMLKLKLNTLVVHNYSGAYPGANTNEPFMNFECRGVGHDGFLDTSISNQRWGLASTRAQDMAFGAGRLLPFDVLGSDAARYTDGQPDAQRNIFLKAKSMLQKVIRYAQARDMEVVLATDLDELPRAIDAAGCRWNDQAVLRARIDDILDTYPTLKYVQLYVGEGSGASTQDVIDALRFVHGHLAARRPGARLVTGGWFKEHRMPAMDRALPEDVIFSTLLTHYMSVRPEWEQLSPGRERWPIPWLEFDGGLSEPQFAVGRMRDVLPRFRAMGAEGMIGIHWRTRALASNVAYLAQDSWQPDGQALDRHAFYRDFAAHQFGAGLAEAGAQALEAIEATGYPKFSTPEFSGWSMCGCADAIDRANAHGAIAERLEALKLLAPDATSRANLDYYARFMRWMRAFWTAHHAVPSAAAKAQPHGGVRINAGGGRSGDLDGDAGFASGTRTYTTSRTVTNDFGYQEAMRSERLADRRPLVYAFEVPNGTHRVELFFQEAWFGVAEPGPSVGKRVFDVEVEGRLLTDNFDIAAAAGGPLRGVKLSYDVPVTDGRLDIRLVNVVSNPKIDIIKAVRVDAAGNPLPPPPGDAVAAWEALKQSGFQESIDAYRGMVGSLPSLGGLVSAAGGRWYEAYRGFERAVVGELAVKPPRQLVAKGLRGGAILSWRPYDGAPVGGYNVYRAPAAGGAFVRLNSAPVAATHYVDGADGDFRYAVTTRGAGGAESPRSFEARVAAGRADHTPPRVFLIPENLEAVAGESLRITATAVDERASAELRAALVYRVGGGPWQSLPMRANVLGQPSTLYADIPPQDEGVVEYYVLVTDGDNFGFGPVAGPRQPLSAAVVTPSGERPGAVGGLTAVTGADRAGVMLIWNAAPGAVHDYEIYRGESPDFPADSAHYLTYVPSQQRAFRDLHTESGRTYHYRVRARSIHERSGPVAAPVAVTVPGMG